MRFIKMYHKIKRIDWLYIFFYNLQLKKYFDY